MSAGAGKNALQGARSVLIDTSLWIYHLEGHAQFAEAADQILEQLELGRFRGYCSELVLLELLVKPLLLQRQDIADEYETLLNHFPHLELIPISRSILLGAAELRAQHKLPNADAIMLATARDCGVAAVVTNDARWRRVSGPRIVLISEYLAN